MRDPRGYYYYPNPAYKTTRMYVRKIHDEIQFRLYSSENPDVWDRHGWLSMEVLSQAAALYQGNANPLGLYDLNVATALLKEAGRDEQ